MPLSSMAGPYGGTASGILLSCSKLEQRKHQGMTKSLEVISETVRDPKHPFRKVDNQPKKPLKHRYERRKVKGYLQLGDWATGEAI
jgi:hypothetical protein